MMETNPLKLRRQGYVKIEYSVLYQENMRKIKKEKVTIWSSVMS